LQISSLLSIIDSNFYYWLFIMDDLIEDTKINKTEKDASDIEELREDIKSYEYKKNGVIKRTLRWTILWIFKIIELVFIFWLILFFLLPILWVGLSIFDTISATWDRWFGWIISMIFGFWIIVIVPLIFVFIFKIFLARGIFKWQRWTIIFTIIVSSILLILSLSKLQIENITINAFILFMAISCIKHPFYAKKT